MKTPALTEVATAPALERRRAKPSIRTEAEREVAAWLCRWSVAWSDAKVEPLWASCDRTMLRQLMKLWAIDTGMATAEAEAVLARVDGRFGPFIDWIRRWSNYAIVGSEFRANPSDTHRKPITAVRIEGAPFVVVLLDRANQRRYAAMGTLGE